MKLFSLPKEITTLSALTALDLHENNLYFLPKDFGNLKALATVDLSNNQLKDLPAEIAGCTSLCSCHVNKNRLTFIPVEIGSLTSLQNFDASDNMLTSIPKEIGNLPKLEWLNLNGNRITTIPKEIGNITTLRNFNLRDNQLIAIPQEIGLLTSLRNLNLRSNQLTFVPKEIGKLVLLQTLYLNENKLQYLPAEIAGLIALQTLYVDSNLLCNIPKEIGSMKTLGELFLTNNFLTDVPQEVREHRAFQKYQLTKQRSELPEGHPKHPSNDPKEQPSARPSTTAAPMSAPSTAPSSGAMSASVDALANAAYAHVHSLMRACQTFISTSRYKSIIREAGKEFNSSRLQLTRTIMDLAKESNDLPRHLYLLNTTQSLGKQATSLDSVLQLVLQEFSHTEQLIAEAVAVRQSAQLIADELKRLYPFVVESPPPPGLTPGIALLAASPSSTEASPTVPSPVESTWQHESSQQPSKKLAVGAMHSNFSFSPATQAPSSSSPSLQSTAPVNGPSFTPPNAGGVPLKQIAMESVAIGRGAFGEVLKGSWHGTDVAVKVIRAADDKIKALVMREVSIMQTIRHPHLVSLLGYEIGEHEVKIVMEYMSGGSLAHMLQDKKVKLTWNQAVKIALEIAKGMTCLHHHEPPVIHRDLKSLNVLVDEMGTAKVSDFGLGRTVSESSQMTERTGSTVWMAPEVMNDEPYGVAADIYSFGIVMWELACRKYPYEGIGMLKLMMGVVNGTLRPPVPQSIPSTWTALMQRCWSGDPLSRPSFDTILTELKAMKLGEGEIGFS